MIALSPTPVVRPLSQVTPRTLLTICLWIVGIGALIFFLAKTKIALTLTLGGAMVAVALNHAVVALINRGVRRSFALALVVGGLGVTAVGLAWVLVPAIVFQGRALISDAPTLWSQLKHSRLVETVTTQLDLGESLGQSMPAASSAVSPVLSALSGALSLVTGVVTLLFLAIFMLIFGGGLIRSLLAELSPTHRARYQRISDKIYRSVGGYLGGLMTVCTINATAATIFLALIQLPFFLPLGILCGASSLIPYAGPVATTSLTILLVLVTVGPWKALAALIFFTFYGQFEGNVLGPLIYRRTVHVNPLITLLSILFLAEFMGVMGGVIAVPVAAAAQIIVRDLLLLRKENRDLLVIADNSPSDS